MPRAALREHPPPIRDGAFLLGLAEHGGLRGVEPKPAEALTLMLGGEGPRRFPLAGVLEEDSDWGLVYQTFTVRDDDTAALAVIFEQRTSRLK